MDLESWPPITSEHELDLATIALTCAKGLLITYSKDVFLLYTKEELERVIDAYESDRFIATYYKKE